VAKQQHRSRKEVLSQPGPSELFAIWASAATDWVKDNLRYVLYGVLGLVAVAIFIVAWISWQGHRREQASVLLYQALKLVDEDPETKQTVNPDQAIQQLLAITEAYGGTPAGARAF
jgi:predicted negative regulator of RcsB-dependent stress response